MENIKHLQKLAEVFDTDKIITSDEIEQVLKGILVIMNSFKKDNQTLNKETKEVVEILLDRVLTENAKLNELVNRETSDQKEDFAKQVKELKDLVSKVQTIKPIDGIDGKDADEEKIVEDVLAKIKLPEYEVYTLEEKGEDIVAEINALPTNEDEYKIDFSHIKNAPEFRGGGGSTARNLYQLMDVQLSAPTDNQVLTYDSTSNTWKNENSAGGGGAWGTITGTLSDQTDLQTALDSKVDENVAITGATKTKITYDAKGLVTAGADATTADIADSSNKRYVTDAQLTVIGNTSGTNTGDQDISGKADKSGALTQFVGNGNYKVWYSDGSGDVTELDLGADGTFLKSNGASVAPTFATPTGSGDVSKVGTPVNNQVGVWTGDGTLEGDSSLTYDGTSFNLATAKNFQIAGATILADAAGVTTLSNIDALDATTESTIETAIDTLANLTSIQGRVVTLADAGADSLFGWDDSASAYQNLSATDSRIALGLATTDSPMFTGIELGHASDTTLTRVSAGVIAVEGNNVARSTDVQVFTSTGANTWTKPANAKSVEVILIGAGGGGGSGSKGTALSLRLGGGGGQGGGYSKLTISASLLGSSETVTVGAGGTGGASQTTNSTVGNDGTNGGNTTFGSFLIAGGGEKGNGSLGYGGYLTGIGNSLPCRTNSDNDFGSQGWGGFSFDSTNGTPGNDPNGNGVSIDRVFWVGGGGGGGSIDTLNTVYDGGAGGAGSYLKDLTGYAGGTAGSGAAGGNGTAATANSPYGGGGGGGGGARHAGGNAYAGGNGGIYGAGGGGGGASTDSVGNSGAGGNGANGIAIIITYF